MAVLLQPASRMSASKRRCRIGTSGYQYGHWRGDLYPEDLARSEWLPYYASRFDTVEINNTFYRLPNAATVDRWGAAVGEDFCFALKFSRYGSHLKHLGDPEDTIASFLEIAERLGDALGPILVQLPPRWGPDPERLAAFLGAAPPRRRWAVEFRDRRWLCEPVFRILRDHGAALCIHDKIEDHPRELTADWLYLRFHGDNYQGDYTHQHLAAEARRIAGYLERGLDVYTYFNNDLGGHAVHNAADLRRYVNNATG